MDSEEKNEDEPPPIVIEAEKPVWKQLLKKSISSPKQLAELLGVPEKELKLVCSKYPARINPYYLSLIKEKNDPIYKQCIPTIQEIQDDFGDEDPLFEEPEHSVRKNVPALLTHRYPDRVLLRISNQCSMYCRFCTRKRKVGDESKQPTWSEISQALEYIRMHHEVRDVILSGGDPLLLDDAVLEKILREVYNLIKDRENSIIRIGTRVPCALPQRVTPELCEVLKKYHPLFMNVHFSHPAEITEDSRRACNMLANAGIPLGCQTVLLKGVNDDPIVMKELMLGLISMRVKPYYIYQADPVKGTNHFRTKVEKGLEIYKALRGHISGLCVPTLVIDAPGGGGKIPLLPEYVVDVKDGKVILKNYEGRTFEYPEIG